MRIKKEELNLFLLGFLTLFLELVLIRYLAGNIWNLGYFPNLVLLSVFIGMGIGFLFRRIVPSEYSALTLALSAVMLLVLVLFVRFARPGIPGFQSLSGDVGGDFYFSAIPNSATSTGYATFGLWVSGIILIFSLISQRTAFYFTRFTPLRAYTLDILGSCSGVLLFIGLSFLQLPAFSWFLIVCLLYLFLLRDSRILERAIAITSCLVFVLVAFQQDIHPLAETGPVKSFKAFWSPYQKVEVVTPLQGEAVIYANGIVHQTMHSAATLQKSFYQIPYIVRAQRKAPPYKNILVIGAGSGNDVAAALMNQVQSIDAVEIDPLLAAIGKQWHPCQPYSFPNVHLTIDDGRSVLTRSHKTYDLVIFALTDSLIKVSSLSQLRLENYLFTVESVKRAYQLLSEKGDLLFYNNYREPWLVQKIQQMVFTATGGTPRILFERPGFSVLMISKDGSLSDAKSHEKISIAPPTDDWPFLYLKQREIPTLYLWTGLGVIVLIALLLMSAPKSIDRESTPGANSTLPMKLAFFFMGVAFLLLETKSVIQFSLLFGTTWINTSLVFLAVLVSVLAANWTATVLKYQHTLWIACILLLGACLFAALFPLSKFLYLQERLLRFFIASAVTFAPIFFANLVFGLSFRDQILPDQLFGWNMFGATLGGVVEYTSLCLGYRNLGFLVLGCYSIVILLLLASRDAKSAELTA